MIQLHTGAAPWRVLLALPAVMVLAAACAAALPAAEPTAEATPEPTVEAALEPTASPTPEPTEAAAACMDPDAYDLLLSGTDLSDADRDAVIAALEEYDFGDLTPEARERAEIWVENYTAFLSGESLADPAILVTELQAGMVPIEPCEP